MIEKVSCINLSSAYGDGQVFGSPSGFKSISIIKVDYGDGLVGYGEAYPGIYAPTIVKAYVDFIADDLVGVSDWEQFDHVTNKHCVSMSGIAKSIIGAIEIALFDIKAKIACKPLSKYLSDVKYDSLKCYYSGGSVVLTPEQIKEDVDRAISLGHEAFKMRVGYQDNDLERVAAAKDALNYRYLMCDAVQSTLHSWDLDKAIFYLKRMEEFKISWAEEFVDPSNPDEVSKFKYLTDTALAFGESFTTLNEFDSLCIRHCLDVAQPDVTQCGGIRAAMEICRHVKPHTKKIAFHTWGGPMAIAANFNVAIAVAQLCEDIDDVWMEIPSTNLKFTEELLHLDIRNGRVRMPEGYWGIGVNIDQDIIEKYAFVKDAVFTDTRNEHIMLNPA
tara:strand:+ start:558 stop:1721 length:1164 start_codon:yes stop_codon:yes gene_type:complete